MNQEQSLIMIVSPNKANADRLRLILSQTFNTLQQNSLAEFEMMYDIMSLKTRMVILDAKFGENTLKSLVKSLRKKNILTEFVLMSDDASFEDSVIYLQTGFRDIIAWSFSDEIILNIVKDVMLHTDCVERIKHLAHRFFYDHFGIEIDLSNIQEWSQKRRLEGQYIRFKDLLDCLPNDNKPQSIFNDIIKSKILTIPETLVKPTLLIVEDDIDARDNIQDLIGDDYNCHYAGSIEEARTKLYDLESIDIAILDMHLPGGMGIELVDEFKAKNNHMEIIVITAYKELEIAILAMKKGVMDYFNKPFNSTQLKVALSKANQRMYFNKYLSLIENYIVQYQLPYKVKLYLLNVFCERKVNSNQDVVMSDIYKFFPELGSLDMPDDLVVPRNVLEDGLMVFVEDLSEKLHGNTN